MKEAVTKIAYEEIKPFVSKMDHEAKMDPAVLQALFDNGLMGIEIPEKFGMGSRRLGFYRVVVVMAVVLLWRWLM